jgi:hypothetical protein
MDTDKFQKNLDVTIENIKSYVDLRVELFKLIIFEKTAKGLVKLFTLIVLVFVVFFVMLFLSLGFVRWYEDSGGVATQGYLVVALFYMLIGIIIFLARKRIFIKTIFKGFSDTAFEEEEEKELLQSGKMKKKNEKD